MEGAGTCPVRLRRPDVVGGTSHRRVVRGRGDAGVAAPSSFVRLRTNAWAENYAFSMA